jgi:hypothetical protein
VSITELRTLKNKMLRMYLNNKDLYVEMIVSKAQGRLTRKAEKMLELLAKETIKKMRYWSNDDKWDCYQGGLLDMFANWYNFNEEKSDEVEYLTTDELYNYWLKEVKK